MRIGSAPDFTIQAQALQNTGQTLGKVSDMLTTFALERRAARNKRDLAHARVEMAREFSALDQQFMADQDFETAEQRWEEGAAAARNRVLSRVQDPELREDVGLELEFSTIRYRNQFSKDVFARERDMTLAQLDEDTEHYLNQYVNAPSDEAAAQAGADFRDALDGARRFAGNAEALKRLDAFEDAARYGRAMRIAEHGDYEGLDMAEYQDLSPEQHESLRGALDKRRHSEAVDAGLAGVKGLAYVDQLEAARGIQDKDVRDEVVQEVERVHALDERIKSERQTAAYDDAWDRAVDTAQGKADKPLTIPEIRASDFTPAQKEHLMAMVKGGADDQAKAMDYHAYGLERRIIAGDGNVDDSYIWAEYRAGRLTKEGKGKLIAAWQDQKTSPSLGWAKEVLLAEFPEADEKNRETYTLLDGTEVETTPKARYLESLNTWLRQFKEDKGRAPDQNEILDMGRKIMRPEVEGSWFFGVGEVAAPFKTGKSMRDFQAEDLGRSVGTEVRWDEEGRFFWWVQNGKTFAQRPDGSRVQIKTGAGGGHE
ncbi:hypothetical protein [Desulfocurvus sp. DL9XJH121]